MEREVFVDAGAWIAITDARDKYHKAASELYKRLIDDQINLVTTNLVVAEAYIIIRRTGGHDPAVHFLRSIRESVRLRKIYSDARVEADAEEILERFADQDFSLADAVSFVVMRDREIEEAFAFDKHFMIAGFGLLPEA
ncbi:MAG: PIN domain-containing protein [Chloroflexota bacterium]|nr:PIN domain-containing protein [Chloroflexota bacterium]